MTSRSGLTLEGTESSHCIANTGPRRFLIVEFDSGSIDNHACLLLHLSKSAGLALVVFSGSKSLQGWFLTVGMSDGDQQKLMSRATRLGADRVMWNKAQFARMPEGTRDNGKRQRIQYFNPDNTSVNDVQEPTEQPVMQLPELLEAISSYLRRYVVFSRPTHADLIALWVVHTWTLSAFDYTPYLHVTSPEKRCGKTTLFELLEIISYEGWLLLSYTEAALFRAIDQKCPSLFLDEIDAVYSTKKGDDGKEALRAIFNGGYKRRGGVPCVARR